MIDKDKNGRSGIMTVLEIIFLLILATVFTMPGIAAAANNNLFFGWATDFHYSQPDDLKKFTDFSAEAKRSNAINIIETGDTIDRSASISDMKKVIDSCKKSGIPECYYALGNHEIDAISVNQWVSTTEMESGNYYFDVGEDRFIVLNTQFHLASAGFAWLKSAVDTTKRVFIFNHIPLDGENNDLDNSIEIRRILDSKGNVVAVFSGHIHKNSAVKKNGIWYITQAPLKDGAYSIVNIGNSNMKIAGHGSAVTQDFVIPTPVPTASLKPTPVVTPKPTPVPTPVLTPTAAPTVIIPEVPIATVTPAPIVAPMPVDTVIVIPTPAPVLMPTPEPVVNDTPIPAPAPIPAETNLVSNSGLENGIVTPVNWTFVMQNRNTPTWDNISYRGSRSVKISILGAKNAMSGYPQSDLIEVQPLTIYIASVWGKTQNAGGANTPAARVVELDANKKWVKQNNIVPVFGRGTNDWSQRTIEFKTDANTRYVYVYANIWNGYGDFWVDDVVLRPKDTVTLNMTAGPTVTLTVVPN